MELSELLKGFLKLFGCDIQGLSESLKIAVTSKNNDVFNKYIEMVGGDLKTDYLQQIFQYYLADRKEKCQDFTPKSIARLVSAMTRNGEVVYDCCSGSGALTIQKWDENPECEFICEELDDRVIPFLLFNLAVRNIRGWVINRNVLTLETMAIYRLTKGNNFSTVEISNCAPSIMADAIISNPPYNIAWDAPEPIFADERFSHCDIPPKGNANYAFVLTALSRISKNGKCAFILPLGVLTQSNETGIRKYLVESGKLEAVISLPEKMFESTSIPVCILLLSEGNETVKMFDCRDSGTTETREQRGQYGGASHERRTYKKEVSVLPDDVIETLSLAYGGDVPGLCKETSREEIAKNDYLLTPSRYIELVAEKQESRPFEDIIKDINRICRERNVLKITANEVVAKELEIDELYALEQESNKISEQMQKTFALFGGEVIKSDYLSLSKNKNELKIENKDKELFSSLFCVLMPMWKQHMFYLNQEENRLLVEFRDALLPKLMSGEIELNEKS